MSDEQGSKSAHPRIDLDTVRETLVYMRDDMASDPHLARIHQALSLALDEIATVAPSALGQQLSAASNVVPIRGPRFVPWIASGTR